MVSKPLPEENIAVPKKIIPNTPLVPDIAATASINKLQVNCEDGLPVQPVSGNDLNDNNAPENTGKEETKDKKNDDFYRKTLSTKSGRDSFSLTTSFAFSAITPIHQNSSEEISSSLSL